MKEAGTDKNSRGETRRVVENRLDSLATEDATEEERNTADNEADTEEEKEGEELRFGRVHCPIVTRRGAISWNVRHPPWVSKRT